jgi:DNA-binding beta-propeller fold protein YncE
MDDLLAGTPALTRLRWLLEGLDGRWPTVVDVDSALTPGFAAQLGGSPALRNITGSRAAEFAPIRVVGVDADATAATARFRTRDDDMWVSYVEVEAEPPHRITLTYTQRWVPDYLTPGLPADFTGKSTTAEIEVHPNGKFVYGSNRGHDSIAVYARDPQSGKLTLVEYAPCGGKAPRHFKIDPSGKWLLVGHQNSDGISVLSLDPETGKLGAPSAPVPTPKPICILFAK